MNEYQQILTAIDSWLRRESTREISLNRAEAEQLINYIQSSTSNFFTITSIAGAVGYTIKVREGGTNIETAKINTEINITDYESW